MAVFCEERVFAEAILEAGEVSGEDGRGGSREAVDDPVCLASGLDHAMAFKVAEVLGDFDLGLFKDLLDVANAKGPAEEEVEDAKAGAVAEALVEIDEFHGRGR